MTTTIEDLWPADFAPEDQTPPVTILRQQAAMLGKKTKNLVEGDVITEATESGSFKHTFYLIAPALDDYRYCLFYIHHELVFYPLHIVDCNGSNTVCPDEDTFRSALRVRFAAENTLKVISTLIAQSKA